MTWRFVAVALALSLWFGSPASAAMFVLGYQANLNDRFYVGSDKAFIGAAYDWSGVGQSSDNFWETMISPSYFVTANHWHASIGDTIQFNLDNSPTGTYETRTVVWSEQVGDSNSDLWLGELSSPVGAGVAIYPILSLPNPANYKNLPLYTVGLADGSGVCNMRLGCNNISSAGGSSMDFVYNTSAGVGSNESYVMSGDSGGPSFVPVDGQLALVGTHSAHSDANPVNGSISIDTFVPFYINAIDAAMLANGSSEQVTLVVPEPSTVVLLSIAAVSTLAYAWRRRRRTA